MTITSRILGLVAAALTLLLSPVRAQQPPAPPPPPASGNSHIPGGNLDLSKVAVPDADRKTHQPDLTEDERKGPMLEVAIIPVGNLPPPILYLDKSGMPREKYRDPLEYAPAVYHVKTKRGSVRLMASQNQVGQMVAVPKPEELELSYQIQAPPSENGSKPAGPSLRTIGSIPISAGATHIAIVLWKDEDQKLWTKPHFQVIDLSPGAFSPHQAVVVNFSGTALALSRGDKPYIIQNSYVGKVALPMNDKGQVLMVVHATDGSGVSEPLSQAVLDTRPEERVFLLAWKVPKDRARPSGVAILPVSKPLFPSPPATAARPAGT